MSYPAFGKVKTIVLPMSSKIFATSPTIKEYKSLTGIDLSENLSIIKPDNLINFDAKGACVYIQLLDDMFGDHLLFGVNHACLPITNTEEGADTEGNFLKMGVYNGGDQIVYGITFFIDSNGIVDLDHIRIRPNLG